jgi:hypothetical protein
MFATYMPFLSALRTKRDTTAPRRTGSGASDTYPPDSSCKTGSYLFVAQR